MSQISRDDYEFLTQFRSADGFECECAMGDYHEVEASDWRRITRILAFLLDGEGED